MLSRWSNGLYSLSAWKNKHSRLSGFRLPRSSAQGGVVLMQVMDGGRGGRLERRGASKAMVAQVGALEGEVHYTLSHQGQGPGLSYCRSSPGAGAGSITSQTSVSQG